MGSQGIGEKEIVQNGQSSLDEIGNEHRSAICMGAFNLTVDSSDFR